MNKIYNALMESVLIQGTLTLGVTFVACYLWLNQLPVPDTLMVLLGAAWGFYFRSAAGNQVRSNIAKDQTLPPSNPGYHIPGRYTYP